MKATIGNLELGKRKIEAEFEKFYNNIDRKTVFKKPTFETKGQLEEDYSKLNDIEYNYTMYIVRNGICNFDSEDVGRNINNMKSKLEEIRILLNEACSLPNVRGVGRGRKSA